MKALALLCFLILVFIATPRAQPYRHWTGKYESTSAQTLTSCDSLRIQGASAIDAGLWKAGYDTSKLYIERCALEPISHYVFGKLTIAAAGIESSKPLIWNDYLGWLKQVLYLNPDSTYYCWDVNEMLTALQQHRNGPEDQAARMAVVSYLLRVNRCPLFTNVFKQTYNNAKGWRNKYWRDTLTVDSNLYPMDTTLPTLEQLDLQVLEGPQFGVVGSPHHVDGPSLLGVRVLKNPIEAEVNLEIELSRESLVSVEIRDILGNAVPTESSKYQLTPEGSHRLVISAPHLRPGAYYIRVTTDWGDTRTVKVISH